MGGLAKERLVVIPLHQRLIKAESLNVGLATELCAMKAKDFFKLVTWEVVNPALLKRKRKHRYQFDESCRGINLGCGLDNPDGWVGIDGGITHELVRVAPAVLIKGLYGSFRMSKDYSYDEYKHRINNFNMIHHDLRYGIPFADSTVPHIYSSHFFEHLYRKDAKKLLKECYRVLQAEGVVRICVPSLEGEVIKLREALEAYERGDSEPIQQFVTSGENGYLGPYSHHCWMYTVEDLAGILAEAGFVDIAEKTYRRGSIPDVEKLDTRRGSSIFVEAKKLID